MALSAGVSREGTGAALTLGRRTSSSARNTGRGRMRLSPGGQAHIVRPHPASGVGAVYIIFAAATCSQIAATVRIVLRAKVLIHTSEGSVRSGEGEAPAEPPTSGSAGASPSPDRTA